MANPEEEKLRLARLYGNMSKGELRQVAGGAAELTDIAHELLVEEIARRGLDISVLNENLVECAFYAAF